MISAPGAETNILIIPKGDTRAGAVFFVDECLTRGLTNSISTGDLRKWATNTITLYQQRESGLAANNAAQRRYPSVLAKDVPEAIKHIQDLVPSCRSDEPTARTKEEEKADEEL